MALVLTAAAGLVMRRRLVSLVALVAWGASRLVRRRTSRRLLVWTPYVVGLPVFLVVLYVFFENFSRLLPANF